MMKKQFWNFIIAGVGALLVVSQIDFNKEPTLYGNIPHSVEVFSLAKKESVSSEPLFPRTHKVYDLRKQEPVYMGDKVNALRANLYFESANQIRLHGHDVAYEQMVWITWVTIKRSYMFHNKSIPDAVLRVKYDKDGKIIKNTAHYSWMADGQDVKIIEKDLMSQEAYWMADEIVHGVLSGKIPDPTNGHDHYCTLAVEKTTKWVKDMKKESRIVIGDHVFYASPYPLTRPRPAKGF
jgi:hypothetical protein